MSTSTPVTERVMPEFKPYDPADSPGPIPSIREQFRRGAWLERPDPVLAPLARYAVVLVPPEHTEALGLHRSSSGLMLYIDGEDMEHPAGLEGAMTLIEDEVGIEVTLVEHRSDLTYWTAIPRSAHHG